MSFLQAFVIVYFGAVALSALHTWMHHVQKAHNHPYQPYLLCAQVIAVIFLIQPKLICMGGGIDPWSHLRATHLFLWKHSGRSALCSNVISHDWSDQITNKQNDVCSITDRKKN